MRTFDELEALWQALPAAPRQRGSVRLLCVRTAPGVHGTPEAVEVSVEEGIVGDRWSDGWREHDPERMAQVTLMSAAVADLVAAGRQPLQEAGDNIFVDLEIGTQNLPVGTRLRVGEAILEVTPMPHAGCSRFAARFGQDALRWTNWRHWRERRLRGVNCRVLSAGMVRIGDDVERLPD